VLSATLADWLGMPRKTTATAFEVMCGWSVTGTVFYDVIITARRHRSVHCLLITDLPPLDPHLMHVQVPDSATMRRHRGDPGGDYVNNFCV